MGTRCGALDPGVILYLLDHQKMDFHAVEKLLYSQSGLLGVSGISSDVRVLLESKDERAKLALDLYTYRIGRELGSLAAALGGLDAIVFTAFLPPVSDKMRCVSANGYAATQNGWARNWTVTPMAKAARVSVKKEAAWPPGSCAQTKSS
jgi:acetate kinase